jgi:hypothetical protein
LGARSPVCVDAAILWCRRIQNSASVSKNGTTLELVEDVAHWIFGTWSVAKVTHGAIARCGHSSHLRCVGAADAAQCARCVLANCVAPRSWTTLSLVRRTGWRRRLGNFRRSITEPRCLATRPSLEGGLMPVLRPIETRKPKLGVQSSIQMTSSGLRISVRIK